MKDLAYTATEQKDNKEKYCCMPDGSGPKYPWGLNLTLETETLAKLGKNASDFKVGSEIPITVLAKVTSISMSEREDGGKHQTVGLMCCQMDLGDGKTSDAEKAEKLYDKE